MLRRVSLSTWSGTIAAPRSNCSHTAAACSGRLNPCRKLPGTLLLVGDLPADAALFQHVLDLQLEGFVAKKRASPYTQGPERCGDWLKVKRKGAVPPERFKRSPKA